MSNYVTTNIRIPEDDYLRLKHEAVKKRKSLSAVIRDKISSRKPQEKSPEEIFASLRRHAASNARYLKGVNIVEVLREMRNHGKW